MSIEPMDARADVRGFAGARLGFAFWAGLVVLLAFLVREYFVLVATVAIPIRGDIREYVVYAWNLYNHGVFSLSEPGTVPPVPDAYRAPGYPWFLLLCMWLRPVGDGWYHLALQLQVLLGTATVALTMLLGRRWLANGWSIAAGVLLALWPHHIVASGALLSEVLFGFTLMVALYALSVGLERRSPGMLAIAGALFGWAYLVNPLIAMFPPVIALLIWRDTMSLRLASLFLAVFLVPVLAFAMRNSQVDTHASGSRVGRVAVNLAQGAWPEYHHAWHAQGLGDPGGIEIMRQINNDAVLIDKDPRAGLASLATRVQEYPGYFAKWYLWQKPLLLWGWDIQIGPGGIYVLVVQHSPLQTHPLLRASTTALQKLNPFITLLAFGGGSVGPVGCVATPHMGATRGRRDGPADALPHRGPRRPPSGTSLCDGLPRDRDPAARDRLAARVNDRARPGMRPEDAA